MLDKGVCVRFYKRKDIQDAIIAHARNKEIGMRYNDSFGKRPDILSYPKEILELSLRGVTSLHASEEIWENPLELESNKSKKELDQLRAGWDLVLDIDCKFVDYSKIAANLIIQFLKYCGVKDISVKFSGNKGFHIGVPFEAFPKKVGEVETKDLFPDAAKRIAYYIKENIKVELGKRIFEFEAKDGRDIAFAKISEKTNQEKEKIKTKISLKDEFGDKKEVEILNVDPFLEIDTVLISSRHLYRMPYSLHEKSGLVSLPIDPEKVMEFQKEMAKPDAILTPMFTFLDRNVCGESARQLLLQALDFELKLEEEREVKKEYDELKLTSPIKEEFFPPCMRLLLQGIGDGKKRGVFILMNYLGKIGWSKEEIEAYLKKWNTNNTEPLREVYIKGQLHGFKAGDKLPPNCSNEAYYRGIGICKPDSFCPRIKNPVNYTILKWKRHLQEKEEQEGLKE
ncbi:MAG: DNA primase small subunit domain-containing protein [Nanoarchaeota archaeon]|nr:DNA primase small subunit domain-containing protein [Nanoarchaeota archaeon]